MPNINRTILVTPQLAPLARALSAGLSSGGVGMFESSRNLNGVLAYYVSSGWIDSAFGDLLPLEGSDQATKDIARDKLFTAANGAATFEQCQALVDTSIVVDCDVESSEGTYARLGLTIGE